MRPSRSTFDAARAAAALVFLDFAIFVSLGSDCPLECTQSVSPLSTVVYDVSHG